MIKRFRLRLFKFRVDASRGMARGFCKTYFLDRAQSYQGGEFFLVKSTFNNDELLNSSSPPSGFALELRSGNQGYDENEHKLPETEFVIAKLKETFGDDIQVGVEEVTFD